MDIPIRIVSREIMTQKSNDARFMGSTEDDAQTPLFRSLSTYHFDAERKKESRRCDETQHRSTDISQPSILHWMWIWFMWFIPFNNFIELPSNEKWMYKTRFVTWA